MTSHVLHCLHSRSTWFSAQLTKLIKNWFMKDGNRMYDLKIKQM